MTFVDRWIQGLGWCAHLGELGSAGVAAAQYARFIQTWRHADPELQPIVQEVQVRLDGLVPDGTVPD